jgi:enamine deaminase RidA (YjgF/YER057c/UK114 family)
MPDNPLSPDDHPYSLVYEKNGIVYVAGAASLDYRTFKPVEGRLEALDAALDEVAKRLASVGIDLSHVAKVTYFVTDISLREEANIQFHQRFKPPRPARSIVEVSGIAYGGKAVIDVIAHR